MVSSPHPRETASGSEEQGHPHKSENQEARERRKRDTRKRGLGGAQARGALERREGSPLPGAAGPQGWLQQGRGKPAASPEVEGPAEK